MNIQNYVRKNLEIYFFGFLFFVVGTRDALFNKELAHLESIIFVILYLVWLGFLLFKRERKVADPPHAFVYGLFMASGFLSVIFSTSLERSSVELHIWLISAFLFFVIYNLIYYGWSKKSLLNSLLIVSTIFIISKILMVVISGSYVRNSLQPNKVAALSALIACLSFSLFLYRPEKRERIFPGILTALSLVVVVGSQSRGGMVSTAVGFLISYMIYKLDQGEEPFNWSPVMTVSLTIGSLVVLGGISYLMRPEISAWTDSINARFDLWGSALMILGEYPLLGSGLNTFSFEVLRHLPEANTIMMAHAHSVYFQIIAERGFIGVMASSLLLLTVLKSLLLDTIPGALRTAGLGSVVIFMVHGLVDHPYTEPIIFRFLIIVLALALSEPQVSGYLDNKGENYAAD